MEIHFDGLVQERRNTNDSALELHLSCTNPDRKVHGANMGPTWVLSAPDTPHVGPTNLAIRVTHRFINPILWNPYHSKWTYLVKLGQYHSCWYPSSSCSVEDTVCSQYIPVIVLWRSCKWRPIACLWGWDMGCHSWMHRVADVVLL